MASGRRLIPPFRRITMWPLGILNKKVVNDPNLTLALLHFDGANNSTIFTDSSPFNRSFTTRFGSPIISTEQSKFGGSSLKLDGSSSIFAADSSDLELLDSDFTFEFWIHPTAALNNVWLVSRWESGNLAYQIYTNGSGKIVIDFRIGGTSYTKTGTTTISINTWTHIAIVRSGSSIKTYINGVLDATANSVTGSAFDGTSRLVIGTWPTGGSGLVGYIDEFRIRKEAMYLTDFTPPTSAFTY